MPSHEMKLQSDDRICATEATHVTPSRMAALVREVVTPACEAFLHGYRFADRELHAGRSLMHGQRVVYAEWPPETAKIKLSYCIKLEVIDKLYLYEIRRRCIYRRSMSH
jgi:hypothetical protein